MEKGFPPGAAQHLPRWDWAASPSGLKSLANGFQAQEMAAPGHPTAYLHFQREESSPQPRGKIGEIASCWRGINGAGTKGSLIFKEGEQWAAPTLDYSPDPHHQRVNAFLHSRFVSCEQAPGEVNISTLLTLNVGFKPFNNYKKWPFLSFFRGGGGGGCICGLSKYFGSLWNTFFWVCLI